MAAFNEFSEITFIDGNSPPINAANLNALENVVALTDTELARSQSFKLSEYLQYFRKRNQKDIDTCQSGFGSYINNDAGSTTLSDEETLKIIGDLGLKILMANNAADYLDFSFSFTAKDLTKFIDSTISTTDDIIMISFYLNDGTAIQGSGGFIYFNIGNGGLGNTYEYDFDIDAWGFDTGWNVAWIPKSSFYIWAGAPNWNNIDFYQMQIDYNAGHQNDYIVLQLIQMVRHDPSAADYLNPFQKYMGSVSGWENKFLVGYDVFSIVFDTSIHNQKLGIMKLNPANFETPFTPGNYKDGLMIYEDVNCFISKFEWICKEDDELPSITFYIDSTHYAEVYVTNSILYLSVANGGAAVNTTWTLDNQLIYNERVVIFFEKHDDTLRAIIQKGNEILGICEYETTFSSSGYICLGVSNDLSLGILTDFAISNSMNQLNLLEDKPIIISKPEDELLNNSNTLQDDNDLYAYLLPNKSYKIEIFIKSITSGGTGIDLRTGWTLPSGSNYGFKHVIGPIVNMTTPSATEVKIFVESITTTVEYGLNNTAYSNIQETFYIRIGEEGGKLQFRWAQRTKTAVNTYMKKNSFMVITPIDFRKR